MNQPEDILNLGQLENLKDYKVFRKITPAIQRYNKNNSKSLNKWYISFVKNNNSEINYKYWISVNGYLENNNLIQSSPVISIENPRTVLTANTKYILSGSTQVLRNPPHSQFDKTELTKFENGFPLEWKEIVISQLVAIFGMARVKLDVKENERYLTPFEKLYKNVCLQNNNVPDKKTSNDRKTDTYMSSTQANNKNKETSNTCKINASITEETDADEMQIDDPTDRLEPNNVNLSFNSINYKEVFGEDFFSNRSNDQVIKDNKADKSVNESIESILEDFRSSKDDFLGYSSTHNKDNIKDNKKTNLSSLLDTEKSDSLINTNNAQLTVNNKETQKSLVSNSQNDNNLDVLITKSNIVEPATSTNQNIEDTPDIFLKENINSIFNSSKDNLVNINTNESNDNKESDNIKEVSNNNVIDTNEDDNASVIETKEDNNNKKIDSTEDIIGKSKKILGKEKRTFNNMMSVINSKRIDKQPKYTKKQKLIGSQYCDTVDLDKIVKKSKSEVKKTNESFTVQNMSDKKENMASTDSLVKEGNDEDDKIHKTDEYSKIDVCKDKVQKKNNAQKDNPCNSDIQEINAKEVIVDEKDNSSIVGLKGNRSYGSMLEQMMHSQLRSHESTVLGKDNTRKKAILSRTVNAHEKSDKSHGSPTNDNNNGKKGSKTNTGNITAVDADTQNITEVNTDAQNITEVNTDAQNITEVNADAQNITEANEALTKEILDIKKIYFTEEESVDKSKEATIAMTSSPTLDTVKKKKRKTRASLCMPKRK